MHGNVSELLSECSNSLIGGSYALDVFPYNRYVYWCKAFRRVFMKFVMVGDMQFGFMSGKAMIVIIFVLLRLQEK